MNDLISRQQAIETLYNVDEYNPRSMKAIKNLPFIQLERKKGTWTKDANCPFCGFQPWYEKDIHTLSFCPNCGADLRLTERNNNV